MTSALPLEKASISNLCAARIPAGTTSARTTGHSTHHMTSMAHSARASTVDLPEI